VADDDRAVMDRLAALEAEVKADAEAQRTRKAAAMERQREQRVTAAAERDPLRARQAARIRASRGREPAQNNAARRAPDAPDSLEDLGGALELASRANRVKKELQRPTRKGDKSWIASGVASFALGPVGWLYAGSWREAVPATAATVLLGVVAAKILPLILLMPALLVAMPLSAIAGIVYALSYNRTGKRQRLFDKDKKQLRGG
jgi:hypothetical protein